MSTVTPRRADARPGEPGNTGTWRTGLRALRHRNYRLFWTGQLFSITGTWMETLALTWLVLDLTNSAVQLSLVSVFQFGPTLVLGLFGGLVADRFPKRTVLLVTQAIFCTLAGLLTVLVATGAIQIWHVFTIAFLTGVTNAVDMPSRQAFVSEMVPQDDLMNAVALNSTIFNVGRILGPAIAGGVLALSGPAVCFGINTFSFFAIMVGLFRMRDLTPVRTAAGSGLERIREGLVYVRATPAVLLPIVLMGLVATFGMNTNIWIPLLAKQDLQSGAGGFGILMAGVGVGSLTGALTLAFKGRRPDRGTMLAAAAVLGGLELVCALAGEMRASALLVVPVLAGMGFAMSMTSALANTTVQTTAPDALRGRVMSVYMTVFSGTVPVGALISGSIAARAGTPASLAFGGAVSIGAAVLVWVASRRLAGRPSLVVAIARPPSRRVPKSSRAA